MASGTTTYRPLTRGLAAGDVIAALRDAGCTVTAERTSTCVVLDTFDGRIAAAGLRLELVDGRQLVLGGDGAVPAGISVSSMPRWPSDLPPGPLRQRLARLAGVRALLPVIVVESQRTDIAKRDADGKIVTSLVLHDAPSVDGSPLAAAVVVEADELTGYPKPAAELRDVLDRIGLVAAGGDLAALAASERNVALGGRDVAVGVPLDADATAIDGFRAVLANLRDAMVANWDGTVADIDPEFLHDLRVSVRRSRVMLANARRVIPDDVRAVARVEFAWLGSITGPARDLDVYQLEWADYTAGLDDEATADLEPLRQHLVEMRSVAHQKLSEDLTSLRARVNVTAWNRWLDEPFDPQPPTERSGDPLSKVVGHRIRRAHGALIERGRTITPATPAETVHELRKDGKKLRYLIECFGGMYDRSARSAFVARLKQLQDTLGTHQDAAVHVEALRELANDTQRSWSVPTMLSIGRLVERLEQVRAASRGNVAKRLADFDNDETVDKLKELLGSARSGQR